MRRLLLRPTAERDVEVIFEFLVDRNPRAAEKFVDSLRTTLDVVQRIPQLGMHLHIEAPQLEGINWCRVEGFANYLVFYRWNDAFIEALRILHAAQDWASKLSE